ncbi:Crp/Fnr family transcriptional regulator [Siculibacillus lacustris]|uniref:Crp/Fnr family transcriptional regulator n=1 Tax=Siculibacillus lacustris TaxID=1549641 RepID=A0A4Q9VWM3_9HYPH|nr:Crp/Fnr family transcriptional regulator [Siculibacillus lacustris]TBW40301.1 Crp/Fnr family transcriptional regulator [Siculibacillus lacustris]
MNSPSRDRPDLDPADLARLREVALFRHVDADVCAAILGGARPLPLPRGSTIMTQGAPADAFHVILEGWVKLYRRQPDGGEAVVAVMTAGESFAEAVMFMGGRYPVTGEAVSDVRLLRIEAATLRTAIRADGRVAIALLASIAHHTEVLSEHVEAIKALSAPQRVADFVVDLARRTFGRDVAGRLALKLPYDKALIARRLGMTPESFSRALVTLREAGVKVSRDAVTIADLDRLDGYARSGEGA